MTFKVKFEHLFQDKELLIVTIKQLALHPHFKLGVVDYLSGGSRKEHIRCRVIWKVMNNIVGDEGASSHVR